jgi:hypothetical protein
MQVLVEKEGAGRQVGVEVGLSGRREVCILPDNCLVPILLYLGIVLTTSLIKKKEKKKESKVCSREKGLHLPFSSFSLISRMSPFSKAISPSSADWNG